MDIIDLRRVMFNIFSELEEIWENAKIHYVMTDLIYNLKDCCTN